MSKTNELIAGRYRTLRLIGEGGMGKVYLGKHVDHDQEVAIKCLRTESRNAENSAKRFWLEACTYASINHPNLVQLHDFERTERGEMRMVLEFVRGETLSQFLKRHGAFHPLFAIDITIQIAQGLSAAHHHEIVHRDLKPDNVMLSPLTRERRHYHVKLLDFGIAKQLDESKVDNKLTAMGMVCGTPDYMSPEQACGHAVDKRSDIYSLGVVFFEMLTGRPAYVCSNKRQVMSAHCWDKIPSIQDFTKYEIPSALEDVMQRCLAKNAPDRYQSLEEMIFALDQVAFSHYNHQVPASLLELSPSQANLKKHPSLKEIKPQWSASAKNMKAKEEDEAEQVLVSYISEELSSSGVSMESVRDWFQKISKGMQHHLEGKIGEPNSLMIGVVFVVILLCAVSVGLTPHNDYDRATQAHGAYKDRQESKNVGVSNPINLETKPLPSSISPIPHQDPQSAQSVFRAERADGQRQNQHFKRAYEGDQYGADLERARVAFQKDQLDLARDILRQLPSSGKAMTLRARIEEFSSFIQRFKKAKSCESKRLLIKNANDGLLSHPQFPKFNRPCSEKKKKVRPPLKMR